MTRYPLAFRLSTTAQATATKGAKAQRKRDRFTQSIFRRFHRVSNKVGSWFHKSESKVTFAGSSSSLELAEKHATAQLVKLPTEQTALLLMKQMEKMYLSPGSDFSETSTLASTPKELLKEKTNLPVLVSKCLCESPNKGYAYFAIQARQTAKMSQKLLTWEEPQVDEWQVVKSRRQNRKVEVSLSPAPVVIPSTLKKMTKQQKIKLGKSKEPIFDTSKHKKVNIYECLLD